jgi:hypothetical protein
MESHLDLEGVKSPKGHGCWQCGKDLGHPAKQVPDGVLQFRVAEGVAGLL